MVPFALHRILLIALATLPSLHSFPSTFDFTSAYLRQQSPRGLQTSGGTLPDLIAPESSCSTLGGLQFLCDIHQRVGTPEDYVDLNATVACDLGVAGFDFRRAGNCGCTVLVTPSNTSKVPKTCNCFVCPVGFGSSAISMDCSNNLESEGPSMAPSTSEEDTGGLTNSPTPTPSLASTTVMPTAMTTSGAIQTEQPTMATTSSTIQTEPPIDTSTAGVASLAPTPANSVVSPFLTNAPTALQTTAARNRYLQEGEDTNATPDPFIFATCVSIDCGGNCNGTCSVSCEQSGPQCAFCEGGEGRPTQAPTGSTDDEIGDLGGGSASPNRGRIAWKGMLIGAAVMLGVM